MCGVVRWCWYSIVEAQNRKGTEAGLVLVLVLCGVGIDEYDWIPECADGME